MRVVRFQSLVSLLCLSVAAVAHDLEHVPQLDSGNGTDAYHGNSTASGAGRVRTVVISATITTCVTETTATSASVSETEATSKTVSTTTVSSSKTSSHAASGSSTSVSSSIGTSHPTTSSTVASSSSSPSSSSSSTKSSLSTSTTAAWTSSSTKSTSSSASVPAQTTSSSSTRTTSSSATSASSSSTRSTSSTRSSSSSSSSSLSSSRSTTTSSTLTTSSTRSSSSSSSSSTSSTRSSSSSSSSTSSTRSSSSSSSSTSSTRTSSSSSSSSTSSTRTSSSSSSSSSSSRSTTSSSTWTTSSSSSTSSSTTSTTSSTTSAAPSVTGCYYWMENVNHQGLAATNPNPAGYKVFRNVKDYGAKGDGVTDDTAAINLAISSGGRCAPGTCKSSTTTPALIYFPPGTYIVSSPIIDYYGSHIWGNPNCLPVIKASAAFNARWVIDGNQYQPGGVLGWGATDVFFRQIRNFVIDMTAIAPGVEVAGVHWPSSQATSLQNIRVTMTKAAGNKQEGLFIESGSGGFMADLTFDGGFHGVTVGSQQFSMRNITVTNAVVGISQLWDWGWTYKGVSISNCQVGLDITSLNGGKQAVGSVVLIDSSITNTPIGVKTVRTADSAPPSGGSLILENVRLNNVATAIQGAGAATLLAGTAGATTIAAWGQGHSYTPAGPTVVQGTIPASVRPGALTAGTDYYERSQPLYANVHASQFLSARTAGAKGDGVADDTVALNKLLATAAATGKVVYLDMGYYRVTGTVHVPAGSRIIGEAFPVILSSGGYFANREDPKPVVQIGAAGGEAGAVEWGNAIVSTKGAQAGAVLVEYNLASPTTAPSGLWDVHTRIGGFAGSDLQAAQCPKTPGTAVTAANVNANCVAAFMSVHVTKKSSGLYLENCWLWVADHDIDDAALTQITVYAGRGLLIESEAGGVWLWGTSVEHHVLYEYQLLNTQKVAMGQIQTETAYYQPNPDALVPFPAVAALGDPVFAPGASGWGLRVVGSSDVFVYGAGLYSFFDNYDVTCSNEGNAEKCQSRIFSVENSHVTVYNLNTIGATKMITVDGADVAGWQDNVNGFISTVALFRK